MSGHPRSREKRSHLQLNQFHKWEQREGREEDWGEMLQLELELEKKYLQLSSHMLLVPYH